MVTIACLGSGPSLTAEDVDLLRGKSMVIAVNDAYRLCRWADALYACDVSWWRQSYGAVKGSGFAGSLWSMSQDDWKRGWQKQFRDVHVLKKTGALGIETHMDGLRSGGSSGFQAINLAVHFGAQRIVLLGYDYRKVGGKGHFFGEHKNKSGPYAPRLARAFDSMVEPLQQLGIEVINCSRYSIVNAFPKAELRDVFAATVAA